MYCKIINNWIVCRMCTVLVHEDCILGIYNTWCEIIHIKIDLCNTAMLFLDVYVNGYVYVCCKL